MQLVVSDSKFCIVVGKLEELWLGIALLVALFSAEHRKVIPVKVQVGRVLTFAELEVYTQESH